MNSLSEAERYLLGIAKRAQPHLMDQNEIESQIRAMKEDAVSRGDQEEAKLLWCYQTVLTIQSHYLDAFYRMKDGQFYDAWCHLEQAEIASNALDRHFSTEDDRFNIKLIRRFINQFQSLYPYRMFSSPAFLAVDNRCSICDSPVSLRNPCGHIVGEIYDGEMCCRVVHEAKLLEVSLVENPVNKYGVAFLSDSGGDHYNYAMVGYVIAGLRQPFDDWTLEWTQKRQPHERYRQLGRNDPCPCHSGKKYKYCCFREAGVLQPHAEITFAIPPPQNLPAFGYVDKLRLLKTNSGRMLGEGIPPDFLGRKIKEV